MESCNLKSWISWPAVRAQLCTLAVAFSFNSTWRVPREAYRYGGVTYLIALSVAMVIVALPATLLQLAIAQLSQQDAVGVWRAAPFFKGVGYLRLIISYMASIYSIVYVALTALIYLLFIVNRSVPFWECSDPNVTLEEGDESIEITSTCMKHARKCLCYCHEMKTQSVLFMASASLYWPRPINATFLAHIGDQPEYYLALSMLSIVLWIIFPFIFYNPVKLMKRILYVFGPLVFLLMIVIASCIGNQSNLSTLHSRHDWRHYMESKIWHSAVTQALLSSQIAGGFLISSGAAIYSNTNVQRTTWLIIGTNVICCWLGVIFWFSVDGGAPRDTSALAVLVQIYRAAENQELDSIWPLLVYAMLFFSGFISMLVFLYPLYDRFRRAGGQGWRIMSFTSSVFGAAAALGVLIGGLTALSILEDTAVPFLISIVTILEIVAFIFIYGWKHLAEDVAFLIERELMKVWIVGWFAAPAVVTAFTAWWLTALFVDDTRWTEPPWQAFTIIATALVAAGVFVSFAVISVTRQVQYDFIGKLKSSFKPSRHWGPRDPITYYYWLARRQESQAGDRENLPSRYNRRQLGQMSGGAIFDISQQKKDLEENT